MKLLFATGNKNKAIEIQALMPKGIEIISLADLDFYDDIPETALTLEGNAQLKAEYVYEKFALNCFADDTGLEITSLNGSPGVFSARYAGEQRSDEANIEKVLAEMITVENRDARFRTVIHLIIDGKSYQFEGVVDGKISHSPSGKNGFGYDPIFEPENCGKTYAELSLEEKNKTSHRARAFRKLVDFINNQL